ncbi:hypothetical protein CONPUDRAFT_166180 [Coniophora puteana RWD-64-598 SS2]|uniref:MYND-type domain-containing protein n=1 Tax=Coniophora puteana (strain RWD-64-598) TaxID=741705 RepID=A0A5M3MP12_CONPW|nr:uncharacterized protein CONPUDRAFT_166180 [Coniophora puteana RWD-64-598 SS2]EIW80760.1 hypothetical protein CONPUDRAFT_166180 [Coniophora puteana RWD-64-598 SS2]
MSCPLLWSENEPFYPYGDTSPVCYTQDLVDGEPASILLLGCGDPMSILQTLHANTTGSQCSRKLDFTCCDHEGGVLARNVFLLTCLADDYVLDLLPSLWNLFFDFFIDKSSVTVLFVYCGKLLDASKSLETWDASPYHGFIKFSDTNTLSVVRGHWERYLANILPPEDANHLKDRFASATHRAQTQHGSWFNYSPVRSAGPLASFAMRTMLHGFRKFWETGVTSHDCETIARAQYVNPTLVHSRGAGEPGTPEDSDTFKLGVHKGLYPPARFYLAKAFATLNLAEPNLAQKDSSVQDASLLKVVVPAAQKQFFRLCMVFSRAIRQVGRPAAADSTESPSHSPISLTFFCGDALAFCKALQHHRDKNELSTPFASAPWSATRIVFDALSDSSSIPTSFDVIDTSTLTDDLGLLNILTHTTPLLKRSSFSALYTETLAPCRDKDGDAIAGTLRSLVRRACCDLGTLALLLGVVPASYVSGFGARPSGFEMMAHRMVRVPLSQFHERLVWRRPMPGTTVVGSQSGARGGGAGYGVEFVPEELAGVLEGVYRRMFGRERGLDEAMERLSVGGAGGDGRRFSDAASVGTCYTQRSYAELVAAIRENVCAGAPNAEEMEASWRRTMDALLELLRGEGDGQRYFQDLCVQLHLLGLHTADVIQPPALDEQRQNCDSSAVFSGWGTIPATVCVVLVVPGQRVREAKSSLDELGTPTLRCEIFGSATDQAFASIEAAYGNVLVDTTAPGEENGVGDRYRCKVVRFVESDGERGLKEGGSDLVISFQVPAAIFMAEPALSVALAVRPQAKSSFGSSTESVLGPKLHVFSSRVDDERHVHVVAQSPFHPECASNGGTGEGSSADVHRRVGEQENVKIVMDDKHEKVETMSVRVDVVGADAREALAGGAAVQMALASGCAVRVLWGGHTHVHAFPLPVDIEKAKLRVARRSSYIEVVAPVATVMHTHNMLFPIFLTPHGPALWNMPRIALDKLPLLVLPNNEHVSRWIVPCTDSMFSLRESAILDGLRPADTDTHRAFLDVKNALHTIIAGAARIPSPTVNGIPGVGHRTAPLVFGLGNPREVRCATLVFVTGVRLDVAAHSVVADAWVLTVTPALLPRRPASLASPLGRAVWDLADELVQLNTDAREARAWKHLLPAAVERCRAGRWAHGAACEYRVREAVPLTVGDETDPLCSCGRGVGAGEHAPFRAGERWHAFAPHVTRAALSPLYAPAYMESGVGVAAFGGRDTRMEERDVCWACGKPPRRAALATGLQVCGKCRVAKYCSGPCQKKDWDKHRWACAILKKNAPS